MAWPPATQVFEEVYRPSDNISTELSTICEDLDLEELLGDSQVDGADRPRIEEPSSKRRRLAVVCTHCNASFTQKKSLYRHQRSSIHCKSASLTQETHPCQYCLKVFARVDVLQRHQKEHHGLSRRKPLKVSHARVSRSELETRSQDDDVQNSGSQQDYGYDRSEETSDVNSCNSQQMHTRHNGHRPEIPAHTFDADGPVEISSLFLTTDETGSPCWTTGSATSLSLTAVETSSTCPTASLESQRTSHNLPFRSRTSLERRGASPGYSSPKNTPPCPACRKPFESDRSALLAHIQSHVEGLLCESVCAKCKIGFQCQENLDFHLKSASRGSCGFIAFPHDCTGHHPPNESGDMPDFSGHEHLMLSSFLRHWEQAQLDALIVGIDDLTTEEARPAPRWSWARCRPAPSTRNPSSVMPPSFRSEPKYVNAANNGRPKATIRFIEQKLASLSNIGPSALIRRKAAENDSRWKAPSLSDALCRAIEVGDVASVQRILDIGPDTDVQTSQIYSFQISFLTRKSRSSASRAVHKHSQKVSPLTLATILGRLQIADILARFGSPDAPLVQSYLDEIDLTGLAMVLEPRGVAPQLMRRFIQDPSRSKKYRSKAGDFVRLSPLNARCFAQFMMVPEAGEQDAWEVAECLIAINYSLGLQAVLDLGIDPNMVVEDGSTSLLTYALSHHSTECALVLIEYGAVCTAEVIPAMAFAVLDIVSRLATQGFQKEAWHFLDRFDRSISEIYQNAGSSLLLAKAIEQHDEVVIKLLTEHYSIHEWIWPSESKTENTGGKYRGALREHEAFGPPLTFAAYHGKLALVRMFLTTGASASETGGMYGSAISSAVVHGDREVVEALLDAGADPNLSLNGHEPPLFCAIRCNRIVIATLLIRRGADRDRDVSNHGTPFICAVRRDNFTMCRYLLQNGTDINFQSRMYGTALCAALSRSPDSVDYLPMVEFLLANGANPSITGPLGNAIEVALSVRKRYSQGFQGMEMDMVVDLLRKAETRCHDLGAASNAMLQDF